ncbi:putative quinol monooxygenase [Pseudomonas marincola]|uniref:putative quinol monooxygenase n=1 Tax=Pseudomonas marincola TaxID=437900 RepID=UPI0008E2C627|nr:putative quinol monooxygenase [Pseudomonas marincola]SFT39990.1 Quinol monooxygenase YgiN [Pseudomonas marincola]
MTVAIFATVTVKPEHRENMEKALQLMVSHSRAEAGNQRYDLFVRADDANVFDIFEIYDDMAAVEAHRESEHYKGYRAQAGEWIAAPVEVRLSNPVNAQPYRSISAKV